MAPDFAVDCCDVRGPVPPLSHAVMGNAGTNLLRTGVRLQRTLEAICDVPLRRRVMDTLGTGIGIDNAPGIYSEDAQGRPAYDFTFFDQILDGIVTPRCIPWMGIGFMPDALSVAGPNAPESAPGLPPEAGAARRPLAEPWMRVDRFPPRDYGRWYDLVHAMVRHCVERYGAERVAEWHWEFWNEPDLRFYWLGTEEELFRTYDTAAEAVRAALPGARIGGPGTAGAAGAPLFRAFLEHCLGGRNLATGGVGVPLDFITFHVKGGATGAKGIFHDPWSAADYERRHPSLEHILRTTRQALETIASLDGTRGLPVFLTECDVDWGTATSIYRNPNMHYRNSEYFAAFQCALVCRMLDLRGEFPEHPIERTFLDTWYIPGFRLFEGQRTLISGEAVEKPILNALRLLGRLGGRRLACSGPGEGPVRVLPTVADGGALRVLAVNFREDFDCAEAQRVRIVLERVPTGPRRVEHWRIDRRHSNAYTAWLEMGRPVVSDDAQLAALQRRMGLERFEPDRTLHADGGRIVLETELPPHSVSLWALDREAETGPAQG